MLAAAESFRPFNWCEKRYFRLAFSPSIRSAEVLERETEMLADKLREEAAALFKNNMCTLAFDSGTVWNRYLCLVLCCSSVGNLFLGAFADEILPSHTTEAVSQALRDTIRDARLRGICVVAAIADNAANFQSVQLVDCTLLRCSAHTIQLVAKDVMPFFQQVVTFPIQSNPISFATANVAKHAF